MPRRRPDGQPDEGGMALVASLLVLMICVILVGGALQLAIHSTQRSGLSRNRTASLHAAEAGLEAQLSLLTAGTCPTAAATEVQLPDQNLPTESYKILAPPEGCTIGQNVVIAATGFVPSAARPVAATTLVAHVNWGLGAPVSGGANGGYVFPDALFSGGVIKTIGGSTLSAYGTGGTVPNIVANGAIDISGSQLDGLVHGWSTVNLNVAGIGGEVAGNGVTINGATVQGAPVASAAAQGGLGGVFSSGSLTLTNTNITGSVRYNVNSTYTNNNSLPGTAIPVQTALQPPRQMPAFNENQNDFQTVLGVGAPAAVCPGSGTGTYYSFSVLAACTYNPTNNLTINGTHVLVAHGGIGGSLIVNVPQTTTGAQLYIIASGSLLGDNIILHGTNSTVPVFVYTDSGLTIDGGMTGQLVGNPITTAAATTTTFTFSPPAIPAPDFAFSTQTQPTSLGYAASIAFQYQCPGTAPC